MIVIMGVTLYTTRIILVTLGVTDFGIYNVVASFVVMFSFLNSALTSATQRFLTFELGKVGNPDLRKVFSISMIIHIGLAFVVFIFAETIGLWFLKNTMNIPLDKMDNSLLVFHFAVLTTMVSIIKVPYHALVIAHENMVFFAYMSILEAALKLLAAYLLVIVAFDKLVAYSAFVFFITVMILSFYYLYNKKYYKEENFIITWDKALAKEIFSFSGWSLFGGLAWMLMNHGLNIMLNVCFGPAINAARGIAMQLNMAIGSLINSFRTAVNPQIIKMYSSDNINEMKHLSILSARYTFYLSFLLILPLYLEIETILNIWLVEVPEWTIQMCQLILILTLITNIDLSFGAIFQAIGKIKENQILSGMIYVLVLPIGYFITYQYNLDPTAVYYIQIIAALINSLIFKFYLMNKLADISFQYYLKVFLVPILKVTIFIVFMSALLISFKLNVFLNILLSVFIVIVGVICVDMDSNLRNEVLLFIKNKQYKR